MLRFIKGFFAKPTPPETPPVAPYKIEAPTTDWPFLRATEIAPEPAPVVTTAPVTEPAVAVKKPRAKKPKSE